ncbi:hypothetical protein [Paramagnetospirillum magneticum]|uniref:hypothetical protein n=1 Tax=Paramagnetospirillum magneticum TaxID=84159 RepID=UPI0005C1D9E5|nr:hypothetical protein [Paramagnetospirillum magneticum]
MNDKALVIFEINDIGVGLPEADLRAIYENIDGFPPNALKTSGDIIDHVVSVHGYDFKRMNRFWMNQFMAAIATFIHHDQSAYMTTEYRRTQATNNNKYN